MSPSGPGGLLNGLLGAALTFLMAAAALYFGVELLRAVWVSLVLVGVLVLAGGAGLLIWRNWPPRGW